MEKIRNAGRPIRVLNLFAYTGGATVACAKAGASVCHVDAAKGMVAWAKENGISDGSAPNGSITREQLAVMLHRTIEYLEDETGRSVLADAGGLESFTDAGQVSGWAADSLAALTASGILQGTSSATLSPKDTTTVEQAILLTLRAYQEFSK